MEIFISGLIFGVCLSFIAVAAYFVWRDEFTDYHVNLAQQAFMEERRRALRDKRREF